MGDDAGTATLTVNVFCRERIAMPPNAALIVALAGVSRADAPAETVASLRIEEPGNVPIDVELTYDPSVIDERFTYAVRATIEVDGKMWWTSTRRTPSSTRCAGPRRGDGLPRHRLSGATATVSRRGRRVDPLADCVEIGGIEASGRTGRAVGEVPVAGWVGSPRASRRCSYPQGPPESSGGHARRPR